MPNLHRYAPYAAVGLALALVACGGDDDPRDAGVKSRDAAAGTDGGSPGTDGGSPGTDGGSPGTDGGSGADTGVMGACNPVDGSGCPASGEFCVLDLAMDRGVCRTLPDMKMFGATCEPTLQDCAPGLLCVGFQGDANPTCHQACRSGMSDCASVPDMSGTYTCAITSMGASFGACRNAGTACNPLDMISCGMGEVCTIASQTQTTCQMAGATQLGGDCSMSNCAEDQGICVPLMNPGTLCYEPCDPMSPACSQANYSCQNLMGLPFGICLPPQMGACNPLSNPCPSGQVCSINQAGNAVECVPEGTVPLGSDCSTMNCMRGGFCVPVQGGGRVCAQPCDLSMPMCPMGAMCQNIGLDFGLCGG